jgi:hypothetical protein
MVTVLSDDLLRELKASISRVSDPAHQAYAAAVVVIRRYLGEAFVQRAIRLSATPDSFMLNDFDEASDSRYIHVARVCALADYLFILRSSDGFEILMRRFLDRRNDTRAVYFDARTASYFKQAGFNVHIRKEIGIKGLEWTPKVRHG